MLFGTRRKAHRRARLGMETMEDRVVPATINVANVAQLQAAVAQVNQSSAPNTIVLASKNYSLPSSLNLQNASDLTIKVAGGRAANLIGEALDRVLTIQNSRVTIQGVGITGGGSVAQGGAIYANTSNVVLRNDTVAGSLATEAGGGIYALGGTLELDHTTVSGNQASNSSSAFGGGIAAVNVAVTLNSSNVMDNQAVAYDQQTQHAVLSGGGGIYAQGGTLTATGTQFVSNTAQSVTSGTQAFVTGGGIETTSTAVSIQDTTFSGNTVNAFSSQSYSETGGAISSMGGSLTIAKSKFTANTPSASAVSTQPGAVVLVQGSTVEGRKMTGRFVTNGKTLIRVR
jgi:hypothetical protein